MFILQPATLSRELVKPLTVIIKRRGQRYRGFVKMGPRRRKQLITFFALFTITLLGIQFTGHSNLGDAEVQLRFINPSLPSERTEDEQFDALVNYPDKKLVIHRGAGRHLQEERDRLPDAIVMRQQTHLVQNSSKILPNLKNRQFKLFRNIDKFEVKKDDEKETGSSLNSLGSHVTIIPAHRIPLSFLKIHHCPACLGMSLCDEFIAGNVTLFQSLDDSPLGGQYPGSWNGRGVVLRAPSEDQVDSFTSFVCANWTKEGRSENCDVSEAIMEGILSRLDADLSPHELKQLIFSQEGNPLSIIR